MKYVYLLVFFLLCSLLITYFKIISDLMTLIIKTLMYILIMPIILLLEYSKLQRIYR